MLSQKGTNTGLLVAVCFFVCGPVLFETVLATEEGLCQTELHAGGTEEFGRVLAIGTLAQLLRRWRLLRFIVVCPHLD